MGPRTASGTMVVLEVVGEDIVCWVCWIHSCAGFAVLAGKVGRRVGQYRAAAVRVMVRGPLASLATTQSSWYGVVFCVRCDMGKLASVITKGE